MSSINNNGFNVDELRFDERGLIPAIARDSVTGDVLMLAYMNRESLNLTLESGYATYFSRSRQSLWKKGETSGHTQKVISIETDCDSDTLLLTVVQTGAACHTGERSCFHNNVYTNKEEKQPNMLNATCAANASHEPSEIINELYGVIADRAKNPVEGSYTNYLLTKGAEKICKKIGEEASETIIAAIKGAKDEVRYEAADLIYHLLVLLFNQGLTPDDVFAELEGRKR